MDILAARINARKCLDLSFKFQELSPAAKKFLGVFGGTTFEMGEKKASRWTLSMLKKALKWRLDKLILIDDPSVRVLALQAMDVIGYRSRHLGLIATLYVSDEIGYKLGQNGEELPLERLDLQVWRYMRNLLDIPSYFSELQGCVNHWEGVLCIDYSKEYSKEMYRDTAGKKPIWRERKVPPEEVKLRIAENKAEVRGFYRHGFSKLLEKKLSGYYERRPLEVHQCLDEIFAYIFRKKLNDQTIVAVLQMLADIARTRHFPERWLLSLSQKYIS